MLFVQLCIQNEIQWFFFRFEKKNRDRFHVPDKWKPFESNRCAFWSSLIWNYQWITLYFCVTKLTIKCFNVNWGPSCILKQNTHTEIEKMEKTNEQQHVSRDLSNATFSLFFFLSFTFKLETLIFNNAVTFSVELSLSERQTALSQLFSQWMTQINDCSIEN